MSAIVLGTEALVRHLSEDAVLSAWLESRDDEVYINTVSIAQLLAQAEASTDPTQRDRWRSMLRDEVPLQFSGQILDFDLVAAKAFGVVRLELDKWLAANGNPEVPEGEDLILSILRAEQHELVEPRQPWHDALSDLKQHDPWTGTTYPL